MGNRGRSPYVTGRLSTSGGGMADEAAGEKAAKLVTVTTTISGATPLPAPSGANFFHFVRVGDEYQFLIGAVNLQSLHDIRTQAAPPTVDPMITHRFILSSFGFKQLSAAVAALQTGQTHEPPVLGGEP